MHCVPPGGMPCEAPVLLVFRVPAWRDRCGIISPACAGGSGGLSMASIPAGLCTVDSSRCNDGSRVGTPHGLVRVRRALRTEADRCNALFLGLSAAARGPARVRPRRGGPWNDRVRRERVFSLRSKPFALAGQHFRNFAKCSPKIRKLFSSTQPPPKSRRPIASAAFFHQRFFSKSSKKSPIHTRIQRGNPDSRQNEIAVSNPQSPPAEKDDEKILHPRLRPYASFFEQKS